MQLHMERRLPTLILVPLKPGNFIESVKDVATSRLLMWICISATRDSCIRFQCELMHICVRSLQKLLVLLTSGSSRASMGESEQRVRLSRFFFLTLLPMCEPKGIIS